MFLIKIVPFVLLTFFALPASAHFFYSYPLFYGEWSPARYVYFGGCEANVNTGCLDWDNSDRGSFFNIGELNVKQGVYTVETVADDHGKIVLHYSYQYYTDESADDTDDVGIIKVKDVATNELYYYRELHAADATNEWVDVRALLPTIVTGSKVQLVFEIQNDAINVSRMHIDAVNVNHINPFAQYTGTVKQEVTGKGIAVEGATVSMKNRAQTKTFLSTTSGADGSFTLYPLPPRKQFKLVVEYQDQVLTYNVKKLLRGQTYSADFEFPEQ